MNRVEIVCTLNGVVNWLSESATTRQESSVPLRTDERRNPACHMYELRVYQALGSKPLTSAAKTLLGWCCSVWPELEFAAESGKTIYPMKRGPL
jgi:hypothetical protein